MKKRKLSILVFSLFISFTLLSTPTFADNESTVADETVAILKEMGEAEITKEDVLTTLENLRDEYNQRLIDETDPIIINQLQIQVESVTEMINQQSNLVSRQDSRSVITSRCVGHNINVAAIVTWFRNNGYTLSADLLVYASKNTSSNNVYYLGSGNVNKIRATSWWSSVKGKWPIAGSSRFTSGDLYYSINKFSYKPASVYGELIISDVYDYTYDTSYPAIQGIAVNAMANAQAMGCITPFKVRANVQIMR
ncbi:hypothetical protein H9L01_09965 [Erysipelothrix inopinata]|uniref:Uncharacterized protein n=1 Tax=Erysipelothrix inopinata TaxID=225084 RepID=A0A7G9RYK2_9FIRM|nr:hypothetical protein [Erysipelothrix inopinata]QNN60677.1 hypothetical protein H9L01_09965 [Erysipelothrix inopinata]